MSESSGSGVTITKKRINQIHVKPMKTRNSTDTRPVKGRDLFSEVYANVFLCAKKKSGKSVVIGTIIKECAGPSTQVLVFCSTVNKDANHLAIRDWCKKHKIKYEGFSSIVEHKVDFLTSFIKHLEKEAEEETLDASEDDEEDFGPKFDKYGGSRPKIIKGMFEDEVSADPNSSESEYSDEEDSEDEMFGTHIPTKAQQKLFSNRNKTSVVVRDKFLAPEYIFVFDDLSHELKLPSLVSLMKKNRHFKSLVICSSQYCHDLKPEQLKQLDYCLLFKGQSDDKLQKFITDCDIGIDLTTMSKIYKDAIKQPYSFLYCDVRNDLFRERFGEMYLIHKNESAEDETVIKSSV